MTSAEARALILNILAGLKLIDDRQRDDFLSSIDKDIELAGLKIDSMSVVDLCVGLEERLGREIAVEELIENPTINQLADHFAKEAAIS